MSNVSAYFQKNRYQPKFSIGDRVTGKVDGIRWMGTVGNDTLISEEVGPVLHIHLDLPLVTKSKRYDTVLVTKHAGVKLMKQF